MIEFDPNSFHVDQNMIAYVTGAKQPLIDPKPNPLLVNFNKEICRNYAFV